MQRKRGLEIGRPLGFPLLVHGSWFPAGALLVAHLTISAYGGRDLVGAVLLSISTVLVFFVCVALKVLVQASVARIFRTPFKDVTLYIFGGIPRSARDPQSAFPDAAIALAGPLTAGVVGIVGLSLASRFHGLPSDVLWTIGVANLALAAVNMLPGFPLDGGRLLVAILSRTNSNRRGAEVTAAGAGQLIGLIAIAGGVALSILRIAAIDDTAVGLWLALTGIFVITCARRSRRASRTVRRLQSATAGQWAKPFAGRLTPNAAVPSQGTYAVAEGGRLAGVVAAQRKGARAADVMVPWTNDIAVRADEPVDSALSRLSRRPLLVVLDDRGAVKGVLDRTCVREHL